MKILFFALFAVLFVGNAQASAGPMVRNAHAMAVDPRSGDVFLFGGADEKRVYGDLWRLRADEWELLAASGPPPRTFAGFVFDEGRESLIVFGGNDALFGSDDDPAEPLSDTWEYRNGTWLRLDTGDEPSPRAEAAMVYDRHSKRILLFGGYALSGGEVKRLGDTWSLSGGK